MIFDKLIEYDKLSLHTPGHKGRIPHLLSMDLTEIDDGNIFPSDTVIKAEIETAGLYGSRACRYLTLGSSNGLKAAIMSVDGDILVFSNCHTSILAGATLARVRACVYQLSQDSISIGYSSGIPLVPTVEDVKNALAMYPEVRAVVITSPDYFGQTVGMDVLQFVKDSGKSAIVDSAHGAHFVFAGLQESCLIGRADIAISSAHKTLHTLTQASIAFVNNSSLVPRFDSALELLSTTSPSYLLLGSIEYGVNYAHNNTQMYKDIKPYLQAITKDIRTLPNTDYTRIVVDCGYYNKSGKAMFDILWDSGIASEMYTDNFLVLLFSIGNTVDEIRRVHRVLMEACR